MLEKIGTVIATKVIEKLGPWLIEQFVKLIPLIVAGVVEALINKTGAKEAVDKVIEADPDLPGISNIFDFSEFLKKSLEL